MKKLHFKRKNFLDNKSKIKQKNIFKYNKKETRNKKNKRTYTENKRKKRKPITDEWNVVVPKDFCIINNTEEVLSFFKSIIIRIRRVMKKNKLKIYFDFIEVENISVGTIMYLLAVLRNLKDLSYRNIFFSGNGPKNPLPKKVFEESGFLNYVNNSGLKIKPNSQKIQIMTGVDVDVKVVKNICDFVNQACGTEISFTHDLYAVLIELITNTKQHAYLEKNAKEIFSVYEWYVYAEENENFVEFVILDTGEGIPSTVNKKFEEIFLPNERDSKFIQTALEGKQRSKTREPNRGKGLPRVVEAAVDGNLYDMIVYSGKGCCHISKDGNNKDIIRKDYQDKLHGTLFTWKINKQGGTKNA